MLREKVILAACALVALAGAVLLTLALSACKPEPAIPVIRTPSPLERLVTHRACDFFTIEGASYAVCDDGSSWKVTALGEAPVVTLPQQ